MFIELEGDLLCHHHRWQNLHGISCITQKRAVSALLHKLSSARLMSQRVTSQAKHKTWHLYLVQSGTFSTQMLCAQYTHFCHFGLRLNNTVAIDCILIWFHRLCCFVIDIIREKWTHLNVLLKIQLHLGITGLITGIMRASSPNYWLISKRNPFIENIYSWDCTCAIRSELDLRTCGVWVILWFWNKVLENNTSNYDLEKNNQGERIWDWASTHLRAMSSSTYSDYLEWYGL